MSHPASLYGPSGDRITVASAAIDWNTDHRVDGGHDAIHEYGRVTPLGVWVDLDYLAQRFTGSGSMTWTVAAGDQVRLRYTLIGQTMTMTWNIANTTTNGGDTSLQIALPVLADGTRYRVKGTGAQGSQSPGGANGTHWYSDNGTVGVGPTAAIPRATFIQLLLVTLGNWAAAADTTRTVGQLSFEVETY